MRFPKNEKENEYFKRAIEYCDMIIGKLNKEINRFRHLTVYTDTNDKDNSEVDR